jgi:AraC-like DNA-binding protein
MPTGLIRSASLTNFGDLARKFRLDAARLLREFDLPQRCLVDPDLEVPIDSVRQLIEAAAERSGIDAFGLMMAETRQLSNLGPAGLLVREQPTLRLALDVLARYARRLNEALFLTVEESGDVVVIREELIVGRSGPIRQSTELAIGVVFRLLRAFLGPAWKPKRVCFAHEPPRDCAVHQRMFGCKVEFGQDFNGIVCARRDLETANAGADSGMARYAQQMLDAANGGDAREATARVRRIVVTLLPTGRCTIDMVAQHLGVDRRTIHRRLAQEGQTFSGIVDQVRCELAARYVKDRSRTLAEVASMLGFSAPSGFSRWYRRQFKATASAQRDRVR